MICALRFGAFQKCFSRHYYTESGTVGFQESGKVGTVFRPSITNPGACIHRTDRVDGTLRRRTRRSPPAKLLWLPDKLICLAAILGLSCRFSAPPPARISGNLLAPSICSVSESESCLSAAAASNVCSAAACNVSADAHHNPSTLWHWLCH